MCWFSSQAPCRGSSLVRLDGGCREEDLLQRELQINFGLTVHEYSQSTKRPKQACLHPNASERHVSFSSPACQGEAVLETINYSLIPLLFAWRYLKGNNNTLLPHNWGASLLLTVIRSRYENIIRCTATPVKAKRVRRQ